MKKLFVVLLMLAAMNASGQWQPDVRLTNASNNSSTSYTNAWCIAANGNTIHTVWFDERDGNSEIYYIRSTDAGITWGLYTRLTNNTAYSINPSVAVFGSVVHVAWQDYRDGNFEIYFKRSTDNGANWGADTRLSNNSADSFASSVAVSGSVVHVVWMDKRDGNTEIYYKRSPNAGVNWGADMRLTYDSAESSIPSVAVSGSIVHVVWYDIRDGNWDIYYKRSTDNGVNWGTDVRLTNNSSFSLSSSVAVSGSVVHVVWYDSRDGNTEIYYKHSTDAGESWGEDVRLTNSSEDSSLPSIAVSGSVVHIVWRDYRDGNYEIYYKRSTDGGMSWGADTRLTNNTWFSNYSSVAVSGSVVHVVWMDYRDGNYEIYYKRNPTGNVGIHNISTETPSKYSLSQNYPNPFNPSTKIKFTMPKSGDAKVIVYDIMGREVQTLVNESLQAGTYEATFDGSALNSGVYFYKLIANGQSETKKMLMIK